MNKKIISGVLILFSVVAFISVYNYNSDRSLAAEIDTELELI